MASIATQFMNSKQFAVVGASSSRSKYGNRVLRWYQANNLNVIPVHPKEVAIEGVNTINSINELKEPESTGVSIITPPSVTLQVLKDCQKLGIKNIWLQPGAEDKAVLDYANQVGLDIIAGGPCILVQGPSLLNTRKE
ncbi:unnamed protein product [Cunninghamella blakesleeana]